MLKSYDAYLVGYYGMQNTGDDALLHATAWGARHVLGCERMKVTSASALKQPELGQIDAEAPTHFRGQLRLRHLQRATQSKRVIFGGGSVLHSARDIHLKRQMIALAGRKRSMALGVGIEDFKSTQDEIACQKFLNECGFIGLRDQQSYDIARSLAPKANLAKTFDLAISLLCSFQPQRLVRQGIMFNFCRQAIDAFGTVNTAQEQARINRAVTLVTQCWQRFGETIYLMNFNGHPELGDQTVHERILDRLPANVNAEIIEYDPNPILVLQRIAGFKATACMRLHGAIMSYMVETPSLMLSYHPKCKSWCEQIGQPATMLLDANELGSDALVTALEQGLSNGFDSPTLSVNQALKLSLFNWSSHDETDSVFRCYPTV